LDVSEETLGRILAGTSQYVIPLYQRPYSWQAKNWATLWEDLVELAEARLSNQASSHFTGTLVLEATTVTTGQTKFLVVDGQQRLTTLSVLLAAIARAWLATGDDMSFKRVKEQYLVNTYAEDSDAYYRLRPANFDEGVFREVVDGKNPKSAQSKIDNAFAYFTRRLSLLDEESPNLKQIEDAVLNGLKFVTITAKADDNVYRIFESINNTGVGLTQADLVRNFVFMNLGSEGARVYESIWLPIVEGLSPEDVETVFWIDALWREPDARKLDVYEKQKKHISRLTPEELITYLGQILKTSDAVRQIRNPKLVRNADLRGRVQRFAELDVPGALVLAARIIYLHETGATSIEEATKAFAVLESYLVRRAITATPVNSIGRICASVAFELEGDLSNSVHRRLSTGRRHFRTDAEIVAAISSGRAYGRVRRDHLKLILQWLLELSQGRDAIDFSSMSIEHVLPQKLSPEAKLEFEQTLLPGEDWAGLHEELVHTMGNLTLTNYNSELSNSPFSVKRAERLKNTSVLANQEIAANESWGAVQIRARSEALARAAVGLWQGPDESLLESEPTSVFSEIDEVIQLVRPGSWTTYGDIAKAVGTVGQVVGMALARADGPNGAWRVMRAGGQISPEFRWHPDSPHTGKTCLEVLESEGVKFIGGVADPEQRLNFEALIERLGRSELPENGASH
jgi:alkylated DNA nucleotide flippase Atl1